MRRGCTARRARSSTRGADVPRVGVVGSLVWDVIYGRDPSAPPVEEWGGIAYALAGLDAALPADWELVPLIKVGRDLVPRAQEFLRTLGQAEESAAESVATEAALPKEKVEKAKPKKAVEKKPVAKKKAPAKKPAARKGKTG